MGMNETPSGERTQIGFFGRCNAGKSSLMNCLSNQNIAIVDKARGTTTDPVKKAMELLPLGPVVLIDTPGLDDESLLGEKRIEKTHQMLRQCDIAILVIESALAVDKTQQFSLEKEFLCKLDGAKKVIFAINKSDEINTVINATTDTSTNIPLEQETLAESIKSRLNFTGESAVIFTSAKENTGISELRSAIVKCADGAGKDRPLIRDLLSPEDVIVLVVPIDSAAPKGRLILPQQQVIRDALEAGAIPAITRETEFTAALAKLEGPPRMVITDSQVFGIISKLTPPEIPLTSFSILMCRYKGNFEAQISGAKQIDSLQENDKILICEGCTHHRQCDDIGTVKLPRWLALHTGKNLDLTFTSGGEYPADLSQYKLIIHCGGCTLPPQEMKHRMQQAINQNIAITNYGVAIAHMQGILPRVIAPFVE